MRRYESLFIIHPDLAQEETQDVADKFQQIIIRNNGKVIKADPLGIRKLSFNIQKQSRGFYMLMDYAGEPEIIKELERNFRIDERILNYQTVKLKNKITEEEIEALIATPPGQPPEKEESEEEYTEQDASAAAPSRAEDVPEKSEEIDVTQPEEHAEEELSAEEEPSEEPSEETLSEETAEKD
ncbi:MAG: 30S ribosomal protein S6 [Deltaproteobacteria bacterium]|nr:30S ribosomal protein S6 [Deltaproteobacteria bacterium]MBW2308048.1 30S ribosomal protein S6 [Deltaproteobacteria bacterium]